MSVRQYDYKIANCDRAILHTFSVPRVDPAACSSVASIGTTETYYDYNVPSQYSIPLHFISSTLIFKSINVGTQKGLDLYQENAWSYSQARHISVSGLHWSLLHSSRLTTTEIKSLRTDSQQRNNHQSPHWQYVLRVPGSCHVSACALETNAVFFEHCSK